MKTAHRAIFDDARNMRSIRDESIDLVVTSPPYPMIQMWDDTFSRLNPAIGKAVDSGNGWLAFELMHDALAPVWRETLRMLKPGGIACINIGDAVRTVGGIFNLYPNHTRLLSYLNSIGFSPLPMILWRKQTNAPNKFMGSGMLPTAAYVTLEHECILIVRKGPNRKFERRADKKSRRESAYFWEERNAWFSDVWWDVKGTGQNLSGELARNRSGAFPFEIPYRLISMYSVKGDTVVDPFLGTGTTMAAAAAAGRNSVGYELEPDIKTAVNARMQSAVETANRRIQERLSAHLSFVEQRRASGHVFKHTNRHYGFAVMTGQETDLLLNAVGQVQPTGENEFTVSYSRDPQFTLAPAAASQSTD